MAAVIAITPGRSDNISAGNAHKIFMWTIIVRDPQGPEIARTDLHEGALVLGRGKDCGIVLPSAAVSRKHARLELRGDKLFFFDEGSANGSMVDGRRVVAPVEVTSRSAIEIMPFKITIEGGAEDENEKTVMFKRPPASIAPAPPRTATPPPPTPAVLTADPSLSDLRPMMPPPSVPSTPAPPAAFNVRFPDSSAAKPATLPASPRPQEEWDAATSELDRHIQGIRNYREQHSDNTNTRQSQLDQGWTQLFGALQNVQKRLAGNPRVQSFGFSRDGKEIVIKIQDPREKRGYRYFTVSRSHPLGKFPGIDTVWVCETGREDINFRDPKEAQTEIFQRIAATLA